MAEVQEYIHLIDSKPIHRFILLFGRIFATVGFAIVFVLLLLDMYFLGMCMAAFLCGMAESQGRCGVSHIGMIAPLKSHNSRMWKQCCLAYSLCGMVTAYFMGLLISGIGFWFDGGMSPYYLGLICVVSVFILLKDLDILRFKVPQCDRQTYKEWTTMFGFTTGVGMWGAHIGLAVTTVITYSGLYGIILVVFGAGIGTGAWLLVSFWLGRLLFLWVTPFLMNSTSNGMLIGDSLERSSGMFRLCSLSGISSILILNFAALYAHFV